MSIKQKKGISLIVLVITIIVMIILATAIILSLNGSGIIGKAREAKIASDNATKEEAVSLKLAEYQLGVQTGEIDSTTTARVWVKEELEKDGIDTSDIAITDDGEIQVGLSEVAVKFVELGVQIGEVVEGYDLSSNTTTSYTTDGIENTAPEEDAGQEIGPTSQTIARGTELEWKYMGIGENGEALIVANSEGNLPEVLLSGKGGYVNGPEVLNTVCDKLYSSDMGKARSMNWEDVTRVLKYDGPQGEYKDIQNHQIKTDKPLSIGEIMTALEITELMGPMISPDGRELLYYKIDYVNLPKTSTDIHAGDEAKSLVFQPSSYFLASTCNVFNGSDQEAWFSVRVVLSSNVGEQIMYHCGNYSYGYEDFVMRPVVSLSSSVQVEYDGTSQFRF